MATRSGEIPVPSSSKAKRHRWWAAIAAIIICASTIAFFAVRGHHSRTPQGAGGLHWTRIAPSVSAYALTSDERGLVAGGPGGRIWTSSDGETWNRADAPMMARFDIVALASHNGRLYAAGRNTADDGPPLAVWSSPDGRSWSRSVLPVDTAASRAGAERGRYGGGPMVSALAAGPGGLVAVGYLPYAQHPAVRIPGLSLGLLPRPLAWYSNDGRTWHTATLPGSASMGRLDSVVAVPGGYLALEGSLIFSGNPRTATDLTRAAGYHGMLFSRDGRRWRVAPYPDMPKDGNGTVGLLTSDGDRVLAVGIGTEDVPHPAGTDVQRGAAGQVHPIVWQRTGNGRWRPPATPSGGPTAGRSPERSPSPTYAAVEAVARVGARLLASGYVRHGDSVDSVLWTSADGGATWSDAVPDGRSTSEGREATALVVRNGLVIALGDDNRLWLARPARPAALGTGRHVDRRHGPASPAIS